MVADQLSRLTFDNDKLEIRDSFFDEQLFSIKTALRYANINNYLIAGKMPSHWSVQDKQRFLYELRRLFYDDPYPFKCCPYQISRYCVPDDKIQSIIAFYHLEACGAHFSSKKMVTKIL